MIATNTATARKPLINKSIIYLTFVLQLLYTTFIPKHGNYTIPGNDEINALTHLIPVSKKHLRAHDTKATLDCTNVV